jgi:hypothetical protein
MGDALSRRDRPFRHTPAEKSVIPDCATELLQAGKIRYSDSPWSANIILVSKKHGGPTLRVAVDCRRLNSLSILVSYELLTYPRSWIIWQLLGSHVTSLRMI